MQELEFHQSVTHGHTRRAHTGGKVSREYNSWVQMKNRCNNPKAVGYKRYGGRGITYDQRWNSFECFLMDMGTRPPMTSLDRIDVNAGYTKSNCRWSTMQVQNNNRSTTKLICINGEKKSVSGWARHYGISSGTIHLRLKNGWSEFDAVTKPLTR